MTIKKEIALLLLFVTAFSCQTKEIAVHKDVSKTFEERSKYIVSQMTLEEKVSQMGYQSPAIDRLEIPEMNWWNECLHGVARAGKATVFPQGIGMSAMWDRAQMFENATAISDEARAKHQEFVSRNKRGIYQGVSCNSKTFCGTQWTRRRAP